MIDDGEQTEQRYEPRPGCFLGALGGVVVIVVNKENETTEYSIVLPKGEDPLV